MLGTSSSVGREQPVGRPRTGPRFSNLLMLLLLGVLLAYANHFENGFHFDDVHTITNNPAIQKLDVGRFFRDGSTFSSLPSNQSYRPWITLMNALDYRIRDGLYPGVFHVHIFLTFLATITLLVYFVRNTLRLHFPPSVDSATRPTSTDLGEGAAWWRIPIQDRLALSVGALFGLLCANAETVNYIIQRAEIESGMFILAGMVAYTHGGFWRKTHVYLLFPVMGFFAKEMAFTFAPLLLVYVLLFEEKADLLHFYKRQEWRKVRQAIWKTLPAFAVTFVCFLFYSKMLPETFSTGSSDRLAYLMTQPFVIGHYVLTFFVPYNLSADTDWTTFSSLSDYRVWVGLAVVGVMLWLALKASARKETRMVSFGLLWFFITLLPTSSVIPLAEVLNDHRCFIPYMGLTIAVIFGGYQVLTINFPAQIRQRRTQRALWILFFIVLTTQAYGVHQRNKVWRDDLSLWKDVTEKSPKNGRGYMNYGLALMARANYETAESNFLKAAMRNPDYALVYINLGILKQATGHLDEAEKFFRFALGTATADHQAHYYYGKFLSDIGRYADARVQLQQALALHPGDHRSRALFDEIASREDREPDDDSDVYKQAKAAAFLNISLARFNEGDFVQCIEAARQALALLPHYAEAYNNIGIAYVKLGQLEEGIAAYRKALEINPDYQLAKNNLAEALGLAGR